ncbi:MAG: M20/M25/M40 family metallo-hydrolase, partial [Tissierellia bacterium]|nr:M20/M25/M40 family metallo-hydrolase [Tissierellia bacterium]
MADINYEKIREQAQSYEKDMTKFLRDLIKLKGESCEEGDKAKRIKEEMEKVGFNKAWIDKQGNVLGEMGTGEKQVAFDAHIDTVGIGNVENWDFDPYEGFEDDTTIGGRGTSDQLGGIVS